MGGVVSKVGKVRTGWEMQARCGLKGKSKRAQAGQSRKGIAGVSRRGEAGFYKRPPIVNERPSILAARLGNKLRPAAPAARNSMDPISS